MIFKRKENNVSKLIKEVNELELRGKIKEAVQKLEKAITLSPNEGSFYNRLGDFHIKLNDTTLAIEAYKKGITVFRENSYYRNALGLCKKILRYAPGNIEIYWTTAELLIELDEKTDALIYLFEYAEKQLVQKNEKEVLHTIDYIKNMEVGNDKIETKINELYKALGKKEFIKETVKPQPPDKKPSRPATEKVSKIEVKPAARKPVVEALSLEKRLKDDLARLDDAIKGVDSAIAELRKALRLDEVIIALDKSLSSLSDGHKKAIGLLQKSISLNLDTLQKSIRELSQGSEKNIKGLEALLNSLSKSLTNMGKNQAAFSQEIHKNLLRVGDDFNKTTKEALKKVEELLKGYQRISRDMCERLTETKDCSVSLVKVVEGMKVDLQAINDALVKFIMSQESKAKTLGRFGLITIIIGATICGILLILLFK